jgi:hypothetical protein
MKCNEIREARHLKPPCGYGILGLRLHGRRESDANPVVSFVN